MKTRHEGLTQAMQDAEMTSRKNQDERYVVKSMAGGLHYYVTAFRESLLSTDKVMQTYYNGVVGRKEDQPPPVKAEEPKPVATKKEDAKKEQPKVEVKKSDEGEE